MRQTLAVEIAAEQVRYMQGRGFTNMDIAAALEWIPYLWPEFGELVEKFARAWSSTQTLRRVA